MKTLTINNQRLQIKEYQEQRVVTFSEIDDLHNRPNGTARRNFYNNKKHFIEGEDYYKIQLHEIRTVGLNSPNGAICLTESGYLMLVKSFTDDFSWSVQKQLVNTYFRQKEQSEQLPIPAYKYFDKTFKGEAVITLYDFQHFTGVAKAMAMYHLKKGKMKNDIDYLLLRGEDLATFKTENNMGNHMASSMYIVTRSGFIKLAKHCGIKIDMPEHMKALPAPKTESTGATKYVRLKDHDFIQVHLGKAIKGAELIADIGKWNNSPGKMTATDYKNSVETLNSIAIGVVTALHRLTEFYPEGEPLKYAKA